MRGLPSTVAVMAAAALLPSVVLAQGAPRYQFLDLGGPVLSANDVNDLGQITGYTGQANSVAFRTAPDAPYNPATDTFTGPFGSNFFAQRINNLGAVAGSATASLPFQRHAFYVAPGTNVGVDLGTLGGPSSAANGVNNLGQIVGWSNTADSPNLFHAFRVPAGRALQPSDDLGTLGGSKSEAMGINDLGQVVGDAWLAGDAAVRAFRTAPGAAINPATDDLGTLGGRTSLGSAINRLGQVVGSSALAGDLSGHAFRTAPDAPINPLTDDLGTLGGPASNASDVNDAGVVVGDSQIESELVHAFVAFPGSAMRDLNDLVNDLPAGWTLLQATGVNNLGQIVGTVEASPSEVHGFLLTPVPEPATGGLLLGASLLMLPRRFRRRTGMASILRSLASPAAGVGPPIYAPLPSDSSPV